MTGAIERELRVARGLASCLGDEAALDEAEAELRTLRARLSEAERLLRAVVYDTGSDTAARREALAWLAVPP